MAKLKEDFEASGGEWKEYKLEDLFYCKTGDVDIQRCHLNGKGTWYINSGVGGLGIIGKTDMNAMVFPANTITVDMFGNPYYRDFEYKMATHAHVFSLNHIENKLNKNRGLFISSALRYFTQLFSFNDMCNWTKMKSKDVFLPKTFSGAIDYIYMEQYISLLEEEKMLQVDKFLKDSGLNDASLTAEETAALEKFRKGEVKFVERKIGELFDKIKVKNLKYKVKEIEGKHDDIYCLPALTAGIENQGLSCFVPRSNATILKNVISVSANGANTGVMFYQPNEFTVLQDSYAIKHTKKEKTSKNEYMFFVSLLQKTIRGNYTWSEKAGWERIKTEYVSVPTTTNNEIDYDFMHHFISAQEKIAIRGVVKYKAEILNANGKSLDFAVAAEPISNYGQKI